MQKPDVDRISSSVDQSACTRSPTFGQPPMIKLFMLMIDRYDPLLWVCSSRALLQHSPFSYPDLFPHEVPESWKSRILPLETAPPSSCSSACRRPRGGLCVVITSKAQFNGATQKIEAFLVCIADFFVQFDDPPAVLFLIFLTHNELVVRFRLPQVVFFGNLSHFSVWASLCPASTAYLAPYNRHATVLSVWPHKKRSPKILVSGVCIGFDFR